MKRTLIRVGLVVTLALVGAYEARVRWQGEPKPNRPSATAHPAFARARGRAGYATIHTFSVDGRHCVLATSGVGNALDCTDGAWRPAAR